LVKYGYVTATPSGIKYEWYVCVHLKDYRELQNAVALALNVVDELLKKKSYQKFSLLGKDPQGQRADSSLGVKATGLIPWSLLPST
jgi:hypothetical protein